MVEIPARPSQTYWNNSQLMGGRDGRVGLPDPPGDDGRELRGVVGRDKTGSDGKVGLGARSSEVPWPLAVARWVVGSFGRGGMINPLGRCERGSSDNARYVASRMAWIAGP